MKIKIDALKSKLSKLLPTLNEKQRRLLVASEANALGRGGVQALHLATGMSRPTIYRGIEDLRAKVISVDPIRKAGAGRKTVLDKNPGILEVLKKSVESGTRGDPESLLRWVCKSVRKLETELSAHGYSISYRTIGRILQDEGYTLQSNRKTSEGKKDHPDRNEQFEYINEGAKTFLRGGDPVISVDTKKKELVGKYKNAGQEWLKKGSPIKVLSHDFPDPKVPKAVPYGVYDVGRNEGWVNVGIDADTSEFAVESIRQWWRRMGKKRYPKAKKLLICADAGGSNGYRGRLWKWELQKLANQCRFEITVLHFPPATSKWNKIEHRLFSYISMNWRGRPLVDYQTVVNLIAATTTKAGLTVKARLDRRIYERKREVTNEQMMSLNMKLHAFHSEWNYTIFPDRK